MIVNNLKKYRIWSNTTQQKLSKELGVSMWTILNIEKYNKYPKYQVRSKICKYFGVNQDQMFYEVENESLEPVQCNQGMCTI